MEVHHRRALSGTFVYIEHEADRMVQQGEGGALVNIVSINSRQPGEGMSAYCSAKAGLEMLTSCAAMEIGPDRIRVTGIGPGLIRTPQTAMLFEYEPIHQPYVRNVPMARSGEPADIASAVPLATDVSLAVASPPCPGYHSGTS